jgi:ribosomal protein S18 acetylase RimI-like enzyme
MVALLKASRTFLRRRIAMQILLARASNVSDNINDSVFHAELLRQAHAIHREYCPTLPADSDNYIAKLQRMVNGGAEILGWQIEDRIVGLAVFRIYENTYGLHAHLHDLVTDPAMRSQGIGGQLLSALEHYVKQRGVRCLQLETGVQRQRAQQFYFKQGYGIGAFTFRKVWE